MRDGLDAVLARELGDPEHLGDAAAARDVGLDEVDVAALDQLAEAPERRVLLAGRDADVDRVGELGVGLVLVGQERLLEPEDAELLERARDADRRLRVVAVAEAGVDQDRHAVAGAGLDRGGGEREVVVGVGAERAPAELDGGEALVRAARRRARARSAGSSGISIEAYARTLSRCGVPISSQTGLPSALPLMSQSAMSMPLIACSAIPRRPM